MRMFGTKLRCRTRLKIIFILLAVCLSVHFILLHRVWLLISPSNGDESTLYPHAFQQQLDFFDGNSFDLHAIPFQRYRNSSNVVQPSFLGPHPRLLTTNDPTSVLSRRRPLALPRHVLSDLRYDIEPGDIHVLRVAVNVLNRLQVIFDYDTYVSFLLTT